MGKESIVRVKTVLLCAAALAAAGRAPASAPDIRDTGRALIETHAGAIVTVKLVLKRRMVVQGQERGSSEVPSEISGTVISATGLTLVSDSASNPWAMFASDSDVSRVDTDTTDVKILLPDGREVPARFVLRDRDLDLAFVQPEGEDLKLPFIALEGTRTAKPLDELLFLYRAGKSLNREISVALGRVQTVVRKPRQFIVSDWISATTALGGPVFDATGGLLGIVVLRRAPLSASDRMQSPMRLLFDTFAPVVLTVPDLKPVADDAARAAAKRASPAE
jgi:hypothetical protein